MWTLFYWHGSNVSEKIAISLCCGHTYTTVITDNIPIDRVRTINIFVLCIAPHYVLSCLGDKFLTLEWPLSNPLDWRFFLCSYRTHTIHVCTYTIHRSLSEIRFRLKQINIITNSPLPWKNHLCYSCFVRQNWYSTIFSNFCGYHMVAEQSLDDLFWSLNHFPICLEEIFTKFLAWAVSFNFTDEYAKWIVKPTYMEIMLLDELLVHKMYMPMWLRG